jgi:hypothetical protein
MDKKKKENKKEESKSDLPEIKVTRKDAIVQEVHERFKSLQEKRGGTPKKQAAEIKTWLEQQPEIESISVYGDSDLTLKFKDKTQIGVLLNRDQMYGGSGPEGELGMVTVATRPDIPGLEGDPHPTTKKACVIDTLNDDWFPPNTASSIVSRLQSAGYEVDFIKNNAANLSFFSTLDDHEYGVVFIRAHGGMMNVSGDDKVHIMVRPFYTTLPPASGFTGVGTFSISTSWGSRYVNCFNNLFVNTYMNNKYFPNTLFHLLVCHGADPNAQNDMIQSLLDRGVGCFTGWTKNASVSHGDPAAVQFFNVLCQAAANPANTVSNTISQISASGHSPDPQTAAVLVAHGLSTEQIIKCFIVNEKSAITIQDAAGKIIRKGFHDVMDAAEFAQNQILGGRHSKLKITQTIYLNKDEW